MGGDARATGLLRRLVTIPLYAVLCLAVVASLPLTVPAAAAIDALRGPRSTVLRALLFFAVYLACEVGGILASGALWLARPLLPRSRWLDAHFALQCWWARSLLRAGQRLFGLRLEVAGDAELGPGPHLVFIRHASVADTLLPAVCLSDRRGLRLRYILKRELLWDPCLDLVGNRLPNYFVIRESGDSQREIAQVARLAEGLRPGEGVLIYPEGTRFSEAKRARLLERAAQRGDRDLLERAQALRHVLPPRPGGPLALLRSSPGADVVFCVHAGFEGATRFSEFLGGGLLGRRIRVQFWRVPASAVPDGEAARARWLFEQWRRIDAWVGEQLAPGGSAG